MVVPLVDFVTSGSLQKQVAQNCTMIYHNFHTTGASGHNLPHLKVGSEVRKKSRYGTPEKQDATLSVS